MKRIFVLLFLIKSIPIIAQGGQHAVWFPMFFNLDALSKSDSINYVTRKRLADSTAQLRSAFIAKKDSGKTYITPKELKDSSAAKAPKNAPTFTGNATFDVNTLFVDAINHYLGVGTLTPGDKVEVLGASADKGITIKNTAQSPSLRFVDGNANAATRNWGIDINHNDWGDFEIWQSQAKGGEAIGLSTGTSRLYINPIGKVSIGTTTFLRSAKLQLSGEFMLSDTLWAGNNITYSYIKPGDALWTSSSASDIKENINLFTAELSNFKNVIPHTYTFKEQNFYKTFDENSIPDSVQIFLGVDIKGNRLPVMISNKEAKDKARAEFVANNLQFAKREAAIVHTGFIAQEFNSALLGKEAKEINYQDVIAALWAKVQELEARIERLEAK